jgi:hypothetical protein
VAGIGVFGFGLLAVAAGGILLLRRTAIGENTPAPRVEVQSRSPEGEKPPTVVAARRLNRAAGVLAFSVLADSGLEHYRGSYENPAMFVPPVVSGLTLAVSAHGTADKRPNIHRARHAVYAIAALTGLAGTGFHIYDIVKRPGGISWLNLFYAAPLGAPAAVALAGLLGYCAEQVRDISPQTETRLFGLPAGRLLAALTSFGMLATVGEVWLLHFRGAFHNPAMYLPVSIPPMASALLGHAAFARKGVDRYLTRWALRATGFLGFAGVGFHAYGVSRNMGGWRNWSQNTLNGPPLPAPPSFTGLALAGLAAMGLMQDHPDA